MNRSQMIHARVEPALKRDAEKIFRALGFSASDVINALYAQVRLRRGIPFALDLPNAGTKSAIRESRQGKGKTFKSVKDFDRHFGI